MVRLFAFRYSPVAGRYFAIRFSYSLFAVGAGL